MRITVQAQLWPPSNMKWLGGKNYVIFTRKFEDELTPETLSGIIRRCYRGQNGATYLVIRYDAPANTLHVEADMLSGSREYMQGLAQEGWALSDEHAKLYGLPTTEEL